MIKDLLLHLQQEWSTLKAAPLTFVFMLILGFLLAYYALRIRYRAVLEIKDERLKAKDDLLDDYRQRLQALYLSSEIDFLEP